jgi:hypothetical protein
MQILKKDVLKEMEEKSRENLDRGIDIAVSILKHEFPFITGWDYKNDPETYRSTIYLVLMADMNLASEFYNSPIRNVYKHAEAKVSYPFSPLEISTELNEEEKYELFKVMQDSLKEIYDEIPSELRHEFESYASEKKEPKELYIEGFIFEKPKENINESEEETTTNYVPIIEEIIEPFKNEDAVCEINVWYDEEDDMYSVYLVLGTEELNDKFYYVDGIRTYRNKLARKIETEIKSYLPIDNLYVGSYGKPNCGWSPLNENWFKVPSSDYNSLEKIINLEMKEKYSWWKDIKINTLNYIELYGDVQIEAELTVDEEWGANQWREFYRISEFPGNKGWEDDGYELVRFGDIIDSTYAEVIRDNLREILRYALNIEAYNMSFRNVYLIFE